MQTEDRLQSRLIDVSAFIDRAKVSGFQKRVLIICGLVALLDGYDAQAIAFVAPAIAADWGLGIAQFGPIFAIGLLGLTLGALVFGPWADRIGRKKAIVLCTLGFGLFSLATAFAASFDQLLAMRFLTGVGLGGAMPNIIALSAEYAPKRLRATLVTVMFCGFPLGALLGGLVSAKLLGLLGWPVVFAIGGFLPVLLVLAQLPYLPESVSYLVARGGADDVVAGILARIDPRASRQPADRYALAEPKLPGVPIRHLFAEHRAVSTLALWTLFFCNLLMLFFLFNWLPTVLARSGLSLEMAIIGTVALNAGGIIGALVLSRLIDRQGPYLVLFLSNCCAAAFIVAIGALGLTLAPLIVVVFLAGFFVIGTQFCIMSHTAGFYPTAVRATGLGWAVGIGRIGSIVGPLIGGILVSENWSIGALFQVAALPAVVSALAIILLKSTAGGEATLAAR